MVQKIHPRGVIWVPNPRLMWADQLKKIDSSSVHILRSPWPDQQKNLALKNELKHVSLQARQCAQMDLNPN